MAKVFKSVADAFVYATENTIKKPLQWILVTVIMFLQLLAGILSIGYFVTASLSADIHTLITSILGYLGLDNLLEVVPASGTPELIVVGIICLIICLILGFFVAGLMIQILGGREITLSGFFKTVFRGIQNILIMIIYEIIAIILITILVFILGAIGQITDPTGLAVSYGIWCVLIILLAIFFAIFMIPALVNFARNEKFGAAFRLKEIFAMIGSAKWYKILAGIIVLGLVTLIVCVILNLIAGLLELIPGILGLILATIFLLLFYVYVFYLTYSYWAKFFAE